MAMSNENFYYRDTCLTDQYKETQYSYAVIKWLLYFIVLINLIRWLADKTGQWRITDFITTNIISN